MSFSDFLAIPCIILMLIAISFLGRSLAHQRSGIRDHQHSGLKGLAFAAAAFGIGWLASQMGS